MLNVRRNVCIQYCSEVIDRDSLVSMVSFVLNQLKFMPVHATFQWRSLKVLSENAP